VCLQQVARSPVSTGHQEEQQQSRISVGRKEEHSPVTSGQLVERSPVLCGHQGVHFPPSVGQPTPVVNNHHRRKQSPASAGLHTEEQSQSLAGQEFFPVTAGQLESRSLVQKMLTDKEEHFPDSVTVGNEEATKDFELVTML
jgi:hypothetical protein